ncbi:MAG: LacI family DNA-binding transcriptional regulator [Anaerolineae bacterium]|nr:LacI family DNA-binding transcriptional regulator [Anaerolineae bacterium]
MQQVADRAGVSRTTVSLVLNDVPHVNIPQETRDRVLQAAQELEYARDYAALSLATGRSHTVAFILHQSADVLAVNLFVGRVLTGVARVLSQADYHLLFYALPPAAPAGAYARLIRSQRVDGLLISGPTIEDPELETLHDEGVPIVMQGTPGITDLPCVDVDNVASARMAVEHLIALGHQRIAHISNAPLTYTASRDRLAGYRIALAEAGLPVDPALISYGSFTDDSGYAAMTDLLARPERPTAVFVASDVVALGAIQAIREHGLRIPDDISVIGFDDIPFMSYIEPGLTTIHLPAIELGYQAGQIMLRLLQEESIPTPRILLETELIVRGSTGPPFA